MPNYPTLAEVAQVSGSAALRGLIDATISATPAINHFYVSELQDTKILTLGIVALPSGGFLNMGEGYSNGHTDTALVEYNAARIGGAVEAQESPMLLYNRAKSRGIQSGFIPDYMSLQIMGRTKGEFLQLENVLFKGTSYDSKGFPGLKALTPFVSGNTLAMTDTAQDSSWAKSVLNVGGSTSNTASSIYSVVYGEEDCALCLGGPGGLAGFLNFETPERHWKSFTDPVDNATKSDYFHVTKAEGYCGLMVAGGNEANASRKFLQRSVRRAANITAQVGYTANDTVLERLEASFPPGKMPNAHFLSFRSLFQIQDARSTAITFNMSPGDAANARYTNRAPVPTHSRAGVPLIATQAIGNTDAIES